MSYHEYSPAWPLNQFVQLIWIQDMAGSGPTTSPERIVADGIVELVFHYKDPFTTRFFDGRLEQQPTSFIIAQFNHPIEIQPNGIAGFISVRFYPWGAYHFFRPPISELADKHVSTVEIWKSGVEEVEARLAEAGTHATRLHIVQSFLLAKLARHHRADRTADQLVRYIHQTQGRLPVAALAEATGVSRRSLERKLIAAVGLSPKHLTRLARFLRACSWIRRRPEQQLTKIAYGCGYYDQAHFIREFQLFAGLTPGQFRQSADTSHLELG